MSVIDQMLAKYELRTQEDAAQALREVMQEIALAGLQRGGFFDKAAFYGGACLRIFHGSLAQLHRRRGHRRAAGAAEQQDQ